LEALGAQKALEILQTYIVRFLKERIRGEKDGNRGGRGRGRGRPKRGGVGGIGRGGTPGVNTPSGPFTSIPVPPPNGLAPPVHEPESGASMEPTSSNGVGSSLIDPQTPISAQTRTPDATISTVALKPISLTSSTPPTGPGHTSESPIIIVDDVDEDEREGPALKKRRLDG